MAKSKAIPTSETLSHTGLSKAVSSFRLAIFLGMLLVASGCVHLALYVILGTTWKGPLSLRKPTLFGISGGLTIWSIAWLMTQLRPRKSDRFLASSLAIGLFIEVTGNGSRKKGQSGSRKVGQLIRG